ncbi:hypothetical protein SMGD1_0481 [Sulfurimonas gotlandica GD1]|uniref:Uncharacterized protein n=1 Tax=Sulfurimonas gotlandica (strain DSM 19862 / JCM 16533 / GD1) TaxID=929558 RepID=H1FV82_SULGG|nr:glycosyltransferase family 39 protein [Sulfurimonas gotlandica]EHP29008.1 hypothetical protein SMGD1_0481 [Sulfurimonas gotlandica GD1]
MEAIKNNYIDIVLFLFGAIILTYASNYGMPIVVHPDEVTQLKNIYGMLQFKTLIMPYESAYSAWIHYFYLIPTIFYWGFEYLFNSDINSISDLKLYAMNNYHTVIPTLRVFSGLFFLSSLFALKFVIEKSINKTQAYIFLIIAILSPWIVINAHNIKHWIPDFSLVFFSFYFYYRYKVSNSILYVLISFVLFSIAIMTTYTLIFLGVYFILLHYRYKPYNHKILFRELILFLSVFIAFVVLSSNLGQGGNIATVAGGDYLKFNIKIEFIKDYLYNQLEFDTFLFISFIASLFLLIFSRYEKNHFKLLIVLVPYLLNMIVMSSHSVFGNYYTVFFVVDSLLLASYFLYFLYDKHKNVFIIIFTMYMFFNTYNIIRWLNILDEKDTRVLAKEWIEKNYKEKNFILYSTLGFNYLPLTKSGINIIADNLPNSLTTREKLYLKYDLNEQVNGMILWKVEQAGYSPKELIEVLLSSGYQPIIIHERFGNTVHHHQRTEKYIEKMSQDYTITQIQEIAPYKKEPDDREKIGDFSLDFRNFHYSLEHMKRSGPVIKIYKVGKK